MAVNVVVVVGVAAGVDVGVGVGSEGQLKVALHSVPESGAVTTIVIVPGL